MEKRRLVDSDLHITALGSGAWALGGAGWQSGWGPQDDRQSIEAIHRALELGINWMDTAAVYGLGHSEALVARALEGRSQQPYVFTRCGLVWDDTVLKADSIERLRAIGKRHGHSPAEVAFAWTAVTGAIVGARGTGRVEGFIGAGAFRLTADEVTELESFMRGARLPHGEQHS